MFQHLEGIGQIGALYLRPPLQQRTLGHLIDEPVIQPEAVGGGIPQRVHSAQALVLVGKADSVVVGDFVVEDDARRVVFEAMAGR